jgi:adenosylcobyric acid synthase
LLDVETVLAGEKTLRQTTGALVASEAAFAGYEIHIGQTDGQDTNHPFARIEGRPHGAMSADGRIAGLYVHGLFDQAEARAAILADLGVSSDGVDQAERVDRALDRIAEVLEAHFDIPALSRIAGLT